MSLSTLCCIMHYESLIKVCYFLHKWELISSYFPGDTIKEGPKISNLKAQVMWFCPYLANPVVFCGCFLPF